MIVRNPFPIKNTQRSKSKEYQFVGAHLERGKADYLSVYAVWRGVGKQTVLQDLVNTFVEREPPVEQVIAVLSNRAVSAWHSAWRENLGKIGWRTPREERHQRDRFCLEMKDTLITRGVPKGYIDQIMAPILETTDAANEKTQ